MNKAMMDYMAIQQRLGFAGEGLILVYDKRQFSTPFQIKEVKVFSHDEIHTRFVSSYETYNEAIEALCMLSGETEIILAGAKIV